MGVRGSAAPRNCPNPTSLFSRSGLSVNNFARQVVSQLDLCFTPLRVMGDSTGLLGRPAPPLDPFDRREPGRCAVVVESRVNPVRFDGGDIPSVTGVERRSQFFLTDWVRA